MCSDDFTPDVKGLFATTDIMALSALEVIEEHGGKMPIIGVDLSTWWSY